MFHYQVASLPIQFTGLNFRDIYHLFEDLEIDPVEFNHQRRLSDYHLIKDICKPCTPGKGVVNFFNPSFHLRGRYLRGNQYNHIFYIDPDGPHTLFITGRPINLVMEDASKFRLKDTIYRYYWEDNNYGYLTQIVEHHPAELYQLKDDHFITI